MFFGIVAIGISHAVSCCMAQGQKDGTMVQGRGGRKGNRRARVEAYGLAMHAFVAATARGALPHTLDTLLAEAEALRPICALDD